MIPWSCGKRQEERKVAFATAAEVNGKFESFVFVNLETHFQKQEN